MEELKTFTLGEFADAIEKNGLPQTYHNFFRDSDGRALAVDTFIAPIAEACAVGMGAINLGVNVTHLRSTLYSDELGDFIPHNICRDIEAWNDGDNLTFKQIADRIRKRYPTMLSRKFAVIRQEYVTVQNG